MIEYPSILHSSKAPRKQCVAFDKHDGSNIRVKWTPKKGFDLFGTRRQLIDHTTPFWNNVVTIFKTQHEERMEACVNKEFKSEQEVILFGEFFGPNSFAGLHKEDDDFEISFFDIMVGKKNRSFVPPVEFAKIGSKYEFPFPEVVYKGNLNNEFIQKVKRNDYKLKEGVVCKGVEQSGANRGQVWMCKIKTDEWIESLKNKFDNWKQMM